MGLRNVVAAALTMTGLAWAGNSYHIGNSMTSNVMLDFFEEVVTDRGKSQTTGDAIIAGAPIYWHWEKETKARNALSSTAYDELVLQTHGLEEKSSAWISRETQAMKNFVDLALEKNPDIRVFLYTYSLRQSEFSNAQSRLKQRREKLVAMAEALENEFRAQSLSVFIIPVADAFHDMVEKLEADYLPNMTVADLYWDDLHPSLAGRYFVSLLHYGAFFKESPVGATASIDLGEGFHVGEKVQLQVDLPPDAAHVFQETAWNALQAEPLSGVDISTGVAPGPLHQQHNRLAPVSANQNTIVLLNGRSVTGLLYQGRISRRLLTDAFHVRPSTRCAPGIVSHASAMSER